MWSSTFHLDLIQLKSPALSNASTLKQNHNRVWIRYISFKILNSVSLESLTWERSVCARRFYLGPARSIYVLQIFCQWPALMCLKGMACRQSEQKTRKLEATYTLFSVLRFKNPIHYKIKIGIFCANYLYPWWRVRQCSVLVFLGSKGLCYTCQLEYVFWLEENMLRAVGQNSLTPLDEQNSQTPQEFSTRTWSGCVPWNRGKFMRQLGRRKANDFFAVFSSFELSGITKHLMIGHKGNSEFCFLST